jgi:hypothetical protein
MPSIAIWRRVHLVRTDFSDERIAYIIAVERIRKLETTLEKLCSVHQLLVTANVVPNALIVPTLIKKSSVAISPQANYTD